MPEVRVGGGATIVGFSYRRAATIIEAHDLLVIVREDKAELLNGIDSGQPDALQLAPGGFIGHVSGTQRWKLEPDPNGAVHSYSWRPKDGVFIKVGQRTRGGERLWVGIRSHFYDFNF